MAQKPIAARAFASKFIQDFAASPKPTQPRNAHDLVGRSWR